MTFNTAVTITADDQADALKYVDECGILGATITPLPGEENGQRRFLVAIEFDARDAMLARFQCAGIFANAPEVLVAEAMLNVGPASGQDQKAPAKRRTSPPSPPRPLCYVGLDHEATTHVTVESGDDLVVFDTCARPEHEAFRAPRFSVITREPLP